MSKAKLKKELLKMDKESVISMVLELYDSRKEAKEYLEYWLDPDPEKALESALLKLRRLFFMPSGKPRKFPSSTSLKALVKGFASLCYDSQKTAALHVEIIQLSYEWLNNKTRVAESVQTAVNKYIASAREYVESTGLEEIYGLRLDRLTDDISDYFSAHPMQTRRRGIFYWGRW